MFQRFTDGARRIVSYTQEECRLLGHGYIGTEHLLLGLLHDGTTTAAPLGEVGVTLTGARDRIGQLPGRDETQAYEQIAFTARAKQVLELSLPHAERFGQGRVTQLHLLLALLDVRDSVAVGYLIGFGVDLEALVAGVDGLASTAARSDGACA